MESFSVRTTLTRQDWLAYLTAAGARMTTARADAPWLTRIAPKALWLAFVAVFVVMMGVKPPLLRPEGLLLLFVSFGIVVWLQRRINMRGSTPLDDGSFLGPAEFDFDANGFHSRRQNSNTFSQWPLVKDVTDTQDHVFLWIDACTAYVLPARGLPAGMTSSTAATRLREFVTNAATPLQPDSTMVLTATETAGAVDPSQAEHQLAAASRPSVAQELAALLRLHVWRVVDATRLYGRDISIILLGVFSLVLWAGLDRLDYEGDVELFWYSISEIGVLVLAVLLAAWVLSRLSRPRIELRQALLLLLGFLPIFVAGIWIAMKLPMMGAILAGVLLTGAADFYLGTGMRSVTGRRQQFAVTSVLVLTLALFYLSCKVYFSPGIWYEPESDAEQAVETRRENEQIVFEQSARINADISSLAPREAGQPNVFFVGFAGFGGQKVFAEEISLAAKQIGDRYGSAQRSLLLVNDERDSLKYPLASAPSLHHALNALSQRMNLDEDVLVLALSSHGSEEGTVSVSSELGYWRDLDATELADMLREAGIRWRVIVVSACYSGTFVEPLKNDSTIILTAAAANRTSFGCSDENDLTYFGEAFYRDALPKAANLRAAFDAARAAILERETHEGMTPSNPQAYFGAAIEQKLAAMEATRTK
jgi:hypothetical protein